MLHKMNVLDDFGGGKVEDGTVEKQSAGKTGSTVVLQKFILPLSSTISVSIVFLIVLGLTHSGCPIAAMKVSPGEDLRPP
jgi:hypothetical protein